MNIREKVTLNLGFRVGKFSPSGPLYIIYSFPFQIMNFENESWKNIVLRLGFWDGKFCDNGALCISYNFLIQIVNSKK